METVMEKKNEGEIAVPSLNVEAMNKALAAAPTQTAEANLSIKLSIFPQDGRAFIGWSVSSNYALGPDDQVDFYVNDSFVATWKIGARFGVQDTGRIWGSGLRVAYWAKSYVSGAGGTWMRVVITPNT
jgi:hypothetical protein